MPFAFPPRASSYMPTSRPHSKGRLPDDTWILRPQDLADGFTPDEDTWYVPRVCGTFKERAGWHGCQMPEQLLGRIIKACSNSGETVLDPFGGSGTTLVVAKKLERRFIGFELSKNYAEQIQARLNAALPGDPLSGADEPKTKAPPTALGKQRKETRKSTVASDAKKIGCLPAIQAAEGCNRDISREIMEAFVATGDGYPVDRVIADPVLNERFVARCMRAGLPGKAFDWNHGLMNLRKAGYFKGISISSQTAIEIDERSYDRYRFACEIAIQRFVQEGKTTLDRLLCDPQLAGSFDQYVLAMIPDQPSSLVSLKIRWFALRIRKGANSISKSSASLKTKIPMARETENPFELSLSKVPPEPGLYWLSGDTKHLYVGETENLRERLKVQFGHRNFNFWDIPFDKLRIAFRTVTSPAAAELPKHQSRWISEWHPIGNYEKLAMRR